MASTTFVDQNTVIEASWLNEVDAVVHDIFDGSASKADARTALDVYSKAEADAMVDDLSGVSDAATARTNLDVYSQAETVALHGRRNVIINGALGVNQRGFSSLAGVPNATATYFADKFLIYNDDGGSKLNVARDTDVPSGYGFATSLSATTTATLTPSAGNELSFTQDIEGYDYKPLESAGYLTASFWVKSNKTGTYSFSLRNTAKDRCYVAEFTVDTSGTWEEKTLTIPLDYSGGTWEYTNGLGLRVNIGLMANSNLHAASTDTWTTTNTPYSTNQANLYDAVGNYFKFTGLQIEAGQVETPFEHRSYGEELALCQRYYWNGQLPGSGFGYQYGQSGVTGSNLLSAGAVTYPVQMRAVPSLSILTTPTYTNCSHSDLQGGTLDGFTHRVTVTASGQFRVSGGLYEADAEL